MTQPIFSKTIGYVVSITMFLYSCYAFYFLAKVLFSFKGKVIGNITDIKGSFIPAHEINYSKFDNYVSYNFYDENGKIYNGKVNSLFLIFEKPKNQILIYYNKNNPTENIPYKALYDYGFFGILLFLLSILLLTYTFKNTI